MTYRALLLALTLALPSAAQAECYAEYKAKRDNPLRLHYGVLLLGASTCPGPSEAARTAQARLAAGGWTLLNIVGLSQTPPSDQTKAHAGEFYLRY